MSEPVPEEQQQPPPSVPPLEPPPPPPPPEPGEPAPGSPAQLDEEHVQEDDVREQQVEGFDLEAFVKSLPDGVVMCPLCLGMGGVVDEPPFDPHTHMCGDCLGRGKVRTGSLVANEAERDCSTCAGRGWLQNEPGEPPATPARAADFATGPPRDYAGRTPDDPDFDWSRVADAPPPPAIEREPVTA